MVTYPTAFQGIRIPWTDVRALERVLSRNRHILKSWAPAATDPSALQITDGNPRYAAADWRIGTCRRCRGRAVVGRNDTWVEGVLLRTCTAAERSPNPAPR